MMLALTFTACYRRLFSKLHHRQNDIIYYKSGNANYMKLF